MIMVVKTQRMKSGFAVLYIRFRTKPLENKGYIGLIDLESTNFPNLNGKGIFWIFSTWTLV